MSADVLRRAAALMRERAKAATDGPWFRGVAADGSPQVHSEALLAQGLAWTDVTTPATAGRDAEHIASWHPAVALAVADWLERLHSFITDFSEYDEDEELTAALQSGDLTDWPEVESALAVATAYLGEQP